MTPDPKPYVTDLVERMRAVAPFTIDPRAAVLLTEGATALERHNVALLASFDTVVRLLGELSSE